jgi:hypothetical protein
VIARVVRLGQRAVTPDPASDFPASHRVSVPRDVTSTDEQLPPSECAIDALIRKGLARPDRTAPSRSGPNRTVPRFIAATIETPSPAPAGRRS